MKVAALWVVVLSGLAMAAPLPKTFQELMATPFCKRYQCYNLPTDKKPATDLGVGTYLFLKKHTGSLFIRSKDGKLTALGWNLPVPSAKPEATKTEIQRALQTNSGFINEFSQDFLATLRAFNTTQCLSPQSSYPSVKVGAVSLELQCYYSSGEILFTGMVK